MELQQHEDVKSTTRYWGYRELTAAELLHVSGGDDSDGDGGGDDGGGDHDNGDTGCDAAGNYSGGFDSGTGYGYTETVASNPMGDNFLGGLGVEGGSLFGGGGRSRGGYMTTGGSRG